MKITWKNLHYYVFGAIVLNMILLYALTKGKAKENQGRVKEMNIIAFHKVVNNATKNIMLGGEGVELNHSNSSKQSKYNPIKTTDGSLSVTEDIGKTIGAGKGGIPVPLAGKIKTFIEKQKESPSSSRTTYIFYIAIFFYLTYGLYFLFHFFKKNQINDLESEPSASYILFERILP